MYEVLVVESGDDDNIIHTSRPFTISQKLDKDGSFVIDKNLQIYVEIRRHGFVIVARSVPFLLRGQLQQ